MSTLRQYTNEIPETQCIGDSLITINQNDANLDTAVQQINNKLTVIPSLMNIRLSLNPTLPVVTDNITISNTLYMHAYKGNAVFLYNTTRNIWEQRAIPNVFSKSLGNLAANTNYDIFLSYSTIIGFDITFVSWGGNTPPTNTVRLVDGVLVNASDYSQRLIGCLRTTNAGQVELNFGRTSAVGGSYPKIHLWNLYNQEPTSFSILETGTVAGINYWDSTIGPGTAGGDNANTNGPWEMFGGPGNKVGFIIREPAVVSLQSIHYTGNDICFYYGYSLNRETPTTEEMLTNTPGQPIYESCRNGDLSQAFNATIVPGYHYIQIVSMTYNNQAQRYLVWTGDRHSYGTVGVLAAY